MTGLMEIHNGPGLDLEGLGRASLAYGCTVHGINSNQVRMDVHTAAVSISVAFDADWTE